MSHQAGLPSVILMDRKAETNVNPAGKQTHLLLALLAFGLIPRRSPPRNKGIRAWDQRRSSCLALSDKVITETGE